MTRLHSLAVQGTHGGKPAPQRCQYPPVQARRGQAGRAAVARAHRRQSAPCALCSQVESSLLDLVLAIPYEETHRAHLAIYSAVGIPRSTGGIQPVAPRVRLSRDLSFSVAFPLRRVPTNESHFGCAQSLSTDADSSRGPSRPRMPAAGKATDAARTQGVPAPTQSGPSSVLPSLQCSACRKYQPASMMCLALIASLLGLSAAENGLVAGGGSVTVYEGPTEVSPATACISVLRPLHVPRTWS